MAAKVDALITAGLRPEVFARRGVVAISRRPLIAVLAFLVVVGFCVRVSSLSAEGLSEDELNKLQAVGDYRAKGLTSANSEHPFLMKALVTGCMVFADKWNSISSLRSLKHISHETALRFPSTLFGALTAVLVFLLAAELFGAEVGLIAAALWTFDPMAIGFNRIAKEDSFLLFFFLLGNVFWLYGQRVAEKTGSTERATKYYWASAAGFGAMMASKYVPQLLTVGIAYYGIFQGIPATRWRLGKKRFLMYCVVMGVVFVMLNPPILFPSTWRQMGQFAGQKLVGHDGYEFMGRLYSHRFTDFLNGTPWYFYHLFILVKLPLLTVAGFLVGLPLLFRRKLGDGRYFILMWMFLWMMTFSFGGGKFTRYFTTVLPAVLITSAIGVQTVGRWLGERLSGLLSAEWPKVYAGPLLGLVMVASSVNALVSASPHFRLYTNQLAGGESKMGYYFPHDEFYDASVRDVVFEIAKRAQPGAQIASETPGLAAYYAGLANRSDLVFVSISDPNALKQLREGDFIVDARGRRYFSNEAIVSALKQAGPPTFTISLGTVTSTSIYLLDQKTQGVVAETARRLPPLVGNTNPSAPIPPPE